MKKRCAQRRIIAMAIAGMVIADTWMADGVCATSDELPFVPANTEDSTSDSLSESNNEKSDSVSSNKGASTANSSGNQSSSSSEKKSGSSKNTVNVKKVTLISARKVGKKKIKVKWKVVKGSAGYQVQYALNKKFTKKKKSKTTKKNVFTITNVKKKKTYYVRVRAYKKSGGKKVYGKWSKVRKPQEQM